MNVYELYVQSFRYPSMAFSFARGLNQLSGKRPPPSGVGPAQRTLTATEGAVHPNLGLAWLVVHCLQRPGGSFKASTRGGSSSRHLTDDLKRRSGTPQSGLA